MSQHARPHIETHSRGKGHSAVAGAAYRLGLKLYDRQTGIWHDYRKRQLGEEIVRAITVAPEGAPEWATNPDELWNRAEAMEKRKDAQVARDFRIPVPFGLSDQQAGDLAEDMARFIAKELHTAVSMGLHRDAAVDAFGKVKPDERQGFHAHLYFPTRRLEQMEGEGGASAWVLGAKLAMLSNRNQSGVFVDRLNQHWSELANRYTAANALTADYDYRSYARMGLPIVPQPKLGPAATAMEHRGFFTRKGDAARDIIIASEVYKAAHAIVLEAQREQAVADVRREAATALPDESVPPPPAAPIDSNASLVARFRTGIGTGATDEERTRHQEALSWVRVIQTALRVLERIAQTLLGFAKERERERAAMMDVEHHIDASRALRVNAHRRVRVWEADHPWRLSLAKAMGGDNNGMPEAWRRLKAEAHTHHDEVQIWKAVMRGHQVALDALAEREAPVLAQRNVQEWRIQAAVKAMAEIDAGLPGRLVAVCKEEERAPVEAMVRAVLPHARDESDAVPNLAQSAPESRRAFRL